MGGTTLRSSGWGSLSMDDACGLWLWLLRHGCDRFVGGTRLPSVQPMVALVWCDVVEMHRIEGHHPTNGAGHRSLRFVLVDHGLCRDRCTGDGPRRIVDVGPPTERLDVGFFRVFGGVQLVVHGDAQARESMEPLNPMSAHLAGLLAATPEIDRAEHSMAPILFGWMLGVAVVAFKVLPAGRWRALFWSGAGAVICSMIPKFAASPDFVLVPANLDWVAGPVAGMLRFPIRWAWLWSLCGGVVAAKVASTLAARWGRLGWLVLIVVVAEAFIRIGTPYRQEFRYIEAPTVLTERAGGVLDLFPVTENRGENHDRWLSNFACVEQLAHGQPIADDCVHTKPRRLRHDLNIWLQDRLLREQMEGVEATLAALGFKTVVLRPDLFTTQHASLMEAEMKSIDTNPTVVREGVHALLFALKGTQNQDIPTMLRDLKPLNSLAFRVASGLEAHTMASSMVGWPFSLAGHRGWMGWPSENGDETHSSIDSDVPVGPLVVRGHAHAFVPCVAGSGHSADAPSLAPGSWHRKTMGGHR